MSPGEWTFFSGSWIHMCDKCQERYKRRVYVCVCACRHVSVLCQTVTSCSPELKVHLQQKRRSGMSSRVCRMLIVYTHTRRGSRFKALNNTHTHTHTGRHMPACVHTHTHTQYTDIVKGHVFYTFSATFISALFQVIKPPDITQRGRQ